jgi:Zn-finger nucleic acid-binding protein
MKCSQCGRDIDESIFNPPLTYCPYCGQNLVASGIEGATEDMPFCPHCGKELPSKVNFCPYCGGELAQRITPSYSRLEESKLKEPRAKPIIEPPPEQKKKADKLYKQWVKYANLPSEVAPSTETPKEKPVGREKKAQRFPVLYILLGFFTVIVIVGFVLLIQSC